MLEEIKYLMLPKGKAEELFPGMPVDGLPGGKVVVSSRYYRIYLGQYGTLDAMAEAVEGCVVSEDELRTLLKETEAEAEKDTEPNGEGGEP